MRRRAPARYSSLTSLLDVLFILLFAALIHAAASVERARGEVAQLEEAAAPPADAGPPPEPDAGAEAPAASQRGDAGPAARPGDDAGPAEPSRDQLYQQALSELARGMAERSATFARISREGVLVSIEREPAEAERNAVERLELSVPLLERVPDPDEGVAYLGERIAELRVCTVVRRHLGRNDLREELVIIVPDVPLADLEVALVRGLRRDQERCLRDEGALGVVVDPGRALDEQPRRSP